MTPARLMRRALLVMLAQAALLAVDACATTQRPDDATRDAIHGHLEACHADADLYAKVHGEDVFRYVHCDQEAVASCKAAGLERMCAQWVGGR